MHLLALIIWLGLCALHDLTQRKISNALTFGGLVAALLCLALTGKSFIGASPLAAVGAFALALGVTLPGYALKRLGAGDVKMLAGLGLATDIKLLLYSWAIACVSQAALYVLGRYLPRFVLAQRTPFAPFVLLGFCLSALLLTN